MTVFDRLRPGSLFVWAGIMGIFLIVPGSTRIASAWAGDHDDSAEVYDTKADAKADIAAALTLAQRKHQRVLLVYGANWCSWCVKLKHLFESDKRIANTLRDEYQVVKVDLGRLDKNMDVVEKYGAKVKDSGIPYLTVLDAQGKVVLNQESESLESGDHHDPKVVLALLKKWQGPSVNAQEVLDGALARAAQQNKLVMLQFSAPWCSWCKRLDGYLADADVSRILGGAFVVAEIDVDRMAGGKAIKKRLAPTGEQGLPWVALLDAKGKVLAHSTGPQGNTGYPVESHEIAHFIQMLRQGGTQIRAQDFQTLEKVLQDTADRIKAPAPNDDADNG